MIFTYILLAITVLCILIPLVFVIIDCIKESKLLTIGFSILIVLEILMLWENGILGGVM